MSTVNLNRGILQILWDTTWFSIYLPPHPPKKIEWFKQRMFLYHWKLHIQTKPQSHAVLHMINVILSTKKKTEVRTFKWKLTKIFPFLVCKTLGKSIQLLSWWGFSVCCSHNNRLVIIFADLSPLDSFLWYPGTTLTVHVIFGGF